MTSITVRLAGATSLTIMRTGGLEVLDVHSPFSVVQAIKTPVTEQVSSRWVQVDGIDAVVVESMFRRDNGMIRDRETKLTLEWLRNLLKTTKGLRNVLPFDAPVYLYGALDITDNDPEEKEEEVTVPDDRPTYTRPNGETYLGRYVTCANMWDVEFLKAAVTAGLVPYLYGDPGTGKTALIEAAFGECLQTLVGEADTDASAFVGSWVQVEDHYEWVDGPLLIAMKTGCPLFVDEVGLIDARVVSILNPLLDGRGWLRVPQNPSLGEIHAEDGFHLLFAGNPNALGVRMSEALLSRLSLPLQVTTDLAIAEVLEVPEWIIEAATTARDLRTDGEISWAPQMREILDASSLDKTFGTPTAANALISMAPAYDRNRVALMLQAPTGLDVSVLSL